MKHISGYALIFMLVFLTSCGINQAGFPQNNRSFELRDSIPLQQSTDSMRSFPSPIMQDSTRSMGSVNPRHNDAHEYTYWVAMRYYCSKTLSDMSARGEVDNELFKKLKKELKKSKSELTSSKFDGVEIEMGMYDIFLKNIGEKFRD